MSACLGPLAFCHLLKKSSGNPFLKICDLTQGNEDPTFFSTDPDLAQLETYSGSDPTPDPT